jgi:hypothetical protein
MTRPLGPRGGITTQTVLITLPGDYWRVIARIRGAVSYL